MLMNSSLAAHYNIARVLRLVWRNPGISRIELAERLGLNPSTVSNIVGELLERGLVNTLALADTLSAGRKKVPLAINAGHGSVGGVQVHSDFMRLVLVDLAGRELHRELVQGPADEGTLYARLRQACERLQERAAVLGTRVLGLGCGLPGIVDPVQGTILQSIPLGITQPQPVSERMRPFFDLPLFLDNDANTCCWGELVASRAPPPNFMFILGEWRRSPARPSALITGIGVGLVLNGLVHHGRGFSAGEFRSVEWQPGNASQFSFEDARVDAARADRGLFLDVVRELARNTALTVHMLNLDQVYLGGFFDSEDAEVSEIFVSEIRRNWAYPTPPSCDVAFSSYGSFAVAFGAAGLFLERAFGDPGALAYLGLESGVPLLMQA